MKIIDYSTVGKHSGSRMALRMEAMGRMVGRMDKLHLIHLHLHNLNIDLSKDI